MDLINTIIKNSSNCFLCFKESNEYTNLNKLLHIETKSCIFEVTLRNVVQYLFPFYDIILNQACSNCSGLILKTYIALKTGLSKLKALRRIINNISKDIINCHVTENLFIHIDGKESVLPVKESQYKENPTVYTACTEKKCRSSKSTKENQKFKKNHEKNILKLQSRNKKLNKTAKIYDCNMCNFQTKKTTYLKAHLYRNHLKSQPYICDICKKGFYTKSNLIEHIKTHSKQKLICEICGDNFSYKKTLEHHRQLHLNSRPYKCDICCRSFVTNSRRNEHIKSRHRDKIFECTICFKKFSLNKDLNRHVKLHHTVMVQDPSAISISSVHA